MLPFDLLIHSTYYTLNREYLTVFWTGPLSNVEQFRNWITELDFHMDNPHKTWSNKEWNEFDYKNKNFLFITIHKANITEKLISPIGFALFFFPDEDLAHLLKIVVHPNSRNKKIAVILIEHSILFLKSINKKEIYLEVATNNNSAIKLYEHFKFNKLHHHKNYYSNNCDAFKMNLLL